MEITDISNIFSVLGSHLSQVSFEIRRERTFKYELSCCIVARCNENI
jgi:hypothetical protein